MSHLMFVLALAVVAFVYFAVVAPKLHEANVITGKPEALADAPSIVAKLWIAMRGYKTVLLAAAGAMAQLLTPDAIQQFQALPWGSVLSQDTANKLTLACSVLACVTHALGVNRAAKATPDKEG